MSTETNQKLYFFHIGYFHSNFLWMDLKERTIHLWVDIDIWCCLYQLSLNYSTSLVLKIVNISEMLERTWPGYNSVMKFLLTTHQRLCVSNNSSVLLIPQLILLQHTVAFISRNLGIWCFFCLFIKCFSFSGIQTE